LAVSSLFAANYNRTQISLLARRGGIYEERINDGLKILTIASGVVGWPILDAGNWILVASCWLPLDGL